MPPSRTQRSDRARQYRAWYSTPQWRALRNVAIDLALHTGDGLCPMCRRSFMGMRYMVVDHRTPHRGDKAKFFCVANLWVICKPCHDGAKQSEERLGFSKAVGEDGWPMDDRHPANIGQS